MKISLNGKFIVSPYMNKNQIEASSGMGFARIQQKIALKGLKLLVPVQLDKPLKLSSQDSKILVIPKGSMVYVKEEQLFTQAWAKNIQECDAIEEKFIIVDAQHVEFVDILESTDATTGKP